MNEDKDKEKPSTDPLNTPDNDGVLREKLVRLKRARSGAKSTVTTKEREITELMRSYSNVDIVYDKISQLDQTFSNFINHHKRYDQLLEDDDEIKESQEYFDLVDENYNDVRDNIQHWIRIARNRNSVSPRDSVSQSTSVRSSSISSAKIKAAAKKAALLIKQASMSKMHALDLQRVKLEQKKDELEIDTKIKMVEAEEITYAEEQEEDYLHENTSPLPVDRNDRPSGEIAVSTNSPRVMIPEQEKEPEIDVQDYGHQLNASAKEWQPQIQQDKNGDLHSLIQQGQQQQRELLSAMQLPRAELAQFDGDPLQYWVFIRAFENSVDRHTMDDSAKLTRLLQYCTGRARKVIQCCAVMSPSSGYAKGKQLLKERFGNDYVILEAWIKRITEGGPIKANDRMALQDFADDLASCKETLSAMRKLSEIDTQRSLVKMVERLPPYLQNRWRKEATDTRRRIGVYPGVADFVKFVTNSAEEINDPIFGSCQETYRPRQETSSASKPKTSTRQNRQTGSTFYATTSDQDHEKSGRDQDRETPERKRRVCPKCSSDHSLFGCDEFKRMKPEERFKLTRDNRLCDNCLMPNHMASKCTKPSTCSVPGCGKKHTKFIHIPTKSEDKPETSTGPRVAGNCCTVGKATATVTLPIVPVKVWSNRKVVHTYALLDSGSTNTFCDQQLVDKLDLKGLKTTLSLSTLGRESQSETSVVSMEVSDINSQEYVKLPLVYAMPKLPIPEESIPTQTDVDSWEHLRGVTIPGVDTCQVMLLIGQDVPEALAPTEIRRGKKGQPYAVKTLLGWTLNGPTKLAGHHRAVANFVHADQRLENQIERFWKIDTSESLADSTLQMSVDDKRALSVWKETIAHKDGHYEMSIPFKYRPLTMPDNMHVAEHRLNLLAKRFGKDPELFQMYKSGINELVDKGYAEEVPMAQTTGQNPLWYLPHHPVLHPHKPGRVRIVFDCAAKYQGTSLNDQVLQGPDTTNKLVGVLLRFRQDNVALMADIEGMYHQVKVTPTDRDVLRFLWWNNDDPEQQMVVYRMTTHLFGGVWSPSCANYALRHTAEDFGDKFDAETVNSVHRDFYVDDLLKSVDTDEKAIRLVEQLRHMLLLGGFKLTKWISNSREVLKSLPVENKASAVKDLDLDQQVLPSERALGVRWNVETDKFEFRISLKEKPLTRRGVVSVISSIYDPLGFLSPCVLQGKLIFQDLCRMKLGWDEPLPADQQNQWELWTSQLQRLVQFVIERSLKPPDIGKIVLCQLHHFSDASQIGYGAVSYLRLVDTDGRVHCTLLMSKSRLAPLKTMTIPRLELSAAVVAVKMDKMLRQELDISVHDSVFWTDSMLVLQYIQNERKRFHTFVANRVAVIQDSSSPAQWHHVDTKTNPADDVSRGLAADQLLATKRWIHGPDFLWDSNTELPTMPNTLTSIDDNDPEVKGSSRTFATSVTQATDSESLISMMSQRYSSWYRLKKGIAWLLRFKKILQLRVHKVKDALFPSGPLTITELRDAETETVKLVQRESFPEELKAIERGQIVKRSSPIHRLEPVKDTSDVLRVGGRLGKSPISDNIKHPMILPRNHHVVNLIVSHYHQISCHSGREHVLSLIRERFWIIQPRRVLDRILRGCRDCRRRSSRPQPQRMAELPADRVTPDKPPFTWVGIDCFGPFHIKRGRSLVKRYGCLFTCLTVRAIHIEIIHSLDTSSFINALQRFISRRGCPERIRSDNGTNFVSAEKELREAIQSWNQLHIRQFLQQKEIEWEFNPPSASHMGGVWERIIRTIRKVLGAVMKEQAMDDEGLATMMCQVEAVINSRPLTAISDDPSDLRPLTPNHLLLLRPGPSLPPGVFVKEDLYRRRWRQVQYLSDLFWRRWTKEYLPILQQRQKWLLPTRNLQIGDIILIADENSPRSLWPLGRVLQTFPGDDGLVRSAQVKTQSSILVRPTDKLCLLEAVDAEKD